MTSMPEYADGSYNAVFDKGALDALMSEDTEDVAEKATAMFQEISRVLATDGKYVCITLAESYILKKIILHFSALHWKISIETLQGGKPSPFRPFCIIITKTVSADHDLSLLVDSLGNEMSISRRVAPAAAVKEVGKFLPLFAPPLKLLPPVNFCQSFSSSKSLSGLL